MAPTRAGLFPAKQAKQASLSPAQPYSSFPAYSPSSPSTASFSPSSPRSPAYSTVLTYPNSSSKTGGALRQHRSMKRHRGILASASSFHASTAVLGLSPSSYCTSPGNFHSVSRASYNRSTTLRPHSHADDCENQTQRARTGHLKTSAFPDKSPACFSRKNVDSDGHANSATCCVRAAGSDRRTKTNSQLSHDLFLLEEVRCRDAVFDVCFHPTRVGLLAAGLVNGGVELHQLPTAEEVSAYLEVCCERRREERVTARQARRLKRRMQLRSSSLTNTGEQQKSSTFMTETPLLKLPRCNGNGTDTAEGHRTSIYLTRATPPVLPNGAFEHTNPHLSHQRRRRRRCANTTDVDDSVASTADDGKEGMSYVRTRSPSRDTTGFPEDGSSDIHAETDSSRKRVPISEQRDVDDEVHPQASISEDISSSSESSSSDEEDELFDETACKKELLNFETRVAALHCHKRGCRAVRFSHDGQRLISSSSDRRLVVSNFEAGDASPCWRSQRQSEAINALCVLTDEVIAAGDDGGCITLWDTRQAPTAEPIVRLQDHEDFISDLAAATVNADGQRQQTSSPANSFISTSSKEASDLPTHIVATGGDMLGVFDLRRKALLARSDALGEDLHCVQIVKNGSKVVCGCQDGSLSIFSWGDFGDMNDRLTGHKQSVDAMAKLEEDILITGSSDGLIRVVQVLPNAILGILGQHKDGLATVEKLALSPDKSLLASCSYDETISISQVAAAQLLIDGRRRREKVRKKPPLLELGDDKTSRVKPGLRVVDETSRQRVADLRKGKDFFEDL